MNIFYFICGFLLLALVDSATTVLTTQTHTVEAPPTTLHPVTTLTPEQECAARNNSCEECLKLAKCLYCKSSRQCTPYPVGKVLPPSSVCQLDDARWGVCWLNFEALIISMGVIGGLIIVVVTVCICCCCCCKDNKKKYAKEDEKWERKKADRKEKANEKKAERRAKTDEIRRKYGLVKDDNPYERFENA